MELCRESEIAVCNVLRLVVLCWATVLEEMSFNEKIYGYPAFLRILFPLRHSKDMISG
jgi:hypothetical protein